LILNWNENVLNRNVRKTYSLIGNDIRIYIVSGNAETKTNKSYFNVKEIEFTRAAENALTSLENKVQIKAFQLLKTIATNFTSPVLEGKVNKLIEPTRNLYVAKLNPKLRIIVELQEDKVKVVDILNHDLLKRYFKGGKA
jgi:hypothetical protein